MQETRVQSLGWEDSLEKEMATHSSTLAWRIPRREEPGRLQSMGSQKVRHDWATSRHDDAQRCCLFFLFLFFAFCFPWWADHSSSLLFFFFFQKDLQVCVLVLKEPLCQFSLSKSLRFISICLLFHHSSKVKIGTHSILSPEQLLPISCSFHQFCKSFGF